MKTPSLKVYRRVCVAHYGLVIEEFVLAHNLNFGQFITNWVVAIDLCCFDLKNEKGFSALGPDTRVM